jgi:rSAM/selenodomain-associated transferase 1
MNLPALRHPHACILLFSRLPRIGKVKTRLIPALGAEGACKLHEQLLQQKLQLLQQQTLCAAELWLDTEGEHPLVDATSLPVYLQQGQDLGERLRHATEAALQRYQQVLIIGTDCPALDETYLAQALAALKYGMQVVLGPALDGGYVLVGLADKFLQLYSDISWGTDQVLEQTLLKVRDAGLSYALLEPLQDIDRPADLKYFSNTYG